MGDAFSVVWEGVSAFKDAIDKQIAAASLASKTIVTTGGHIVEAHVKQRMSGSSTSIATASGHIVEASMGSSTVRVVTGALRRSVGVDKIEPDGPMGWRSETGPRTVYGRRIELGFKGTDSIGRSYNQEGRFPTKLGLEDADPELVTLHRVAWANALRV